MIILLCISSASLAYWKKYCKGEGHSLLFVYLSLLSEDPMCTHFSKFKRSSIIMFTKLWKHLSRIAILFYGHSSISWIDSSICCTIDSVSIKTGRSLRSLSQIFERPSEDFSTQLCTILCDKTSSSTIVILKLNYVWVQMLFSNMKLI